MTFIVGNCYTRGNIHAAVGGEIVTYLPERDGCIVAGCFDPKSNLDAPLEIQVGKGPHIERKAQTLKEQEFRHIPVFLKRRINEWQYQGIYEFIALSSSREEIEAAEAKSGRRGGVACLLRFRPY